VQSSSEIAKPTPSFLEAGGMPSLLPYHAKVLKEKILLLIISLNSIRLVF